MEPHEAHRGSQNTSAQKGKVTGKDRSATGCNQENAKPGESILQGPQCRLYYRLVSNTSGNIYQVGCAHFDGQMSGWPRSGAIETGCWEFRRTRSPPAFETWESISPTPAHRHQAL